MMNHFLVPLDGSPDGESVLPHLRRLAMAGASEITLVRVEMPPAVEQFDLVSDAALERAQAYLSGIQGRLSDLAAPCHIVARIGSPAPTIVDLAVEKRATLILMAVRRTSTISRLLFGSVSREILRTSPVPVLAVPPAWSYELAPPIPTELQPVRKILVPLAFEEESLDVLPAAIDLSRLLGAKLLMLHVDPPDAARAGLDHPEVRSRLAGRLCDAVGAASRAGVEASFRTETGDVVPTLLNACREEGIDLIAMATHGRGGLSRWLTGSFTEDLLRESNLPTLVVRCAPEGKAPEPLPADSFSSHRSGTTS